MMLNDVALAAALSGALATWDLAGADVDPLGGGMNSATALVTAGEHRYVAKWVPDAARHALLSGAWLAEKLAATGLVTGPPRPAVDGSLVVALAGGWCALGDFVPGAPLTGETDRDQRDQATILAAAHAATIRPATAPFFAWLRADLPSLDVEAWVPPAVAAALAAYAALPQLTHAWLHTDPAPEAFRRDGDAVGLIDWTGAEVGPALYDVASAAMYLGGLEDAGVFLDTYSASGVLHEGELAHLRVLLRYRWAVQAAYFADRIVAADVTGSDEAGNRKGLADARRGLEA
jgi:Ser/Thr protein kinase RdoA (MazF antagonist)